MRSVGYVEVYVIHAIRNAVYWPQHFLITFKKLLFIPVRWSSFA